jgi:hypothetical protein
LDSQKILHFIGFTKKSCILLAFIGFHAKILGARYFGVPGIPKNKKSSTFFHFVADTMVELPTVQYSVWLTVTQISLMERFFLKKFPNLGTLVVITITLGSE